MACTAIAHNAATASSTLSQSPSATSMAAQSSIHLHFYSHRLTVSACHLLLCAAAYAKSSWQQRRDFREMGRQRGEGRQVGRLQLQAESESHVRQTVAMSQIFIARLQEIQRVHIPHSVLSGTVARVKQKHKYTDTRHLSLICPTVPGHGDASPVWQLAARAHLSVYLPSCAGLVACLLGCLVACCMWQQREAAATTTSVQCVQLTYACLIAFELAPWLPQMLTLAVAR